MSAPCTTSTQLGSLLVSLSSSHVPHDDITAIAATPSTSHLIVAVRGLLKFSAAGGFDWRTLILGAPSPDAVDKGAWLAIDSRAARNIWLIDSTRSVYRALVSSDYTWRLVSRLPSSTVPSSFISCTLEVSKSRVRPFLFAATANRLWFSDNKAGSWQRLEVESYNAGRLTSLKCLPEVNGLVGINGEGRVGILQYNFTRRAFARLVSRNLRRPLSAIQVAQSDTTSGTPPETMLLIGDRTGTIFKLAVPSLAGLAVYELPGPVSDLAMSNGAILGITPMAAVYRSAADSQPGDWAKHGNFPPGKQAVERDEAVFRVLSAYESKVVMAGHSGVFTSADGGLSWYEFSFLIHVY